MKSLGVTLLVAAFATLVSLRAEGALQAAVVATETNVDVREISAIRVDGRRNLEVGEVYEVHASSGRFLELKVDATHVALVPPSAVRVRSCTQTELSAAKAKYNVLSSETQREARQVIADGKRQAVTKAGQLGAEAQCANCPTARAGGLASAQAADSQARKQYTEQKKTLRTKNQALAKEALAWAAAGRAK